jgi:flagellum-specific ATP synthase
MEGDDMMDPVADMSKSVLDGHIILSRELAIQNLFPAIDVLHSISRVAPNIIDDKHKGYAGKFIEAYSTYKQAEDMINLGAYKPGSSRKIDRSIALIEKLKQYLRQGMDEKIDLADSLQSLYFTFDDHEGKDA